MSKNTHFIIILVIMFFSLFVQFYVASETCSGFQSPWCSISLYSPPLISIVGLFFLSWTKRKFGISKGFRVLRTAYITIFILVTILMNLAVGFLLINAGHGVYCAISGSCPKYQEFKDVPIKQKSI